MRLPERKDIDELKAREQLKAIEEGGRIARKVDGLRELAAKTEAEYVQYRDTALKEIQAEINEKIAERDTLRGEIERLQKNRIQAQAPLNLQESWAEVRKRAQEQEKTSMYLIEQEISLVSRENNVRDSLKEVEKREREVSYAENKAQELLQDAERARNEAQVDREDALNLKQGTEEFARKAHAALDTREQELANERKELALKEEQLAVRELEIINEKRFLADQRATLERGFAELRRKQNG